MGKAKPELKLDVEFEWVDNAECARKSRLKCCPDMERISNTWGLLFQMDSGPYKVVDGTWIHPSVKIRL